MNRIEEVIETINLWDRRRKRVEGFYASTKGLLFGLLAGVLLATISRFDPIFSNRELAISIVIMAVFGLVIGAAIAWSRPRSVILNARFADRAFNLMERTSTAIELHKGVLETDADLVEHQLDDTLSVVRSVDAAKMLPWKYKRSDLYLILTSIFLLSAAVILDNPAVKELDQQRAIDKVVAEQIETLESLEQSISGNPDLGAGDLEELTAPIESALKELSENDVGLEELFATLSEAEAEFRDLSAKNDTSELLEKIQEAARPLSQNEQSHDFGEALSSSDLAGAGIELNALADGLATLNLEESSELASSLAQAAEALTTVDPQLAEALAEGSEALNAGDIDRAQGAMREAAATLQQRELGQATASQASAAADQLQQSRDALADAGETNQAGEAGQENGDSQSGGNGSGEGTGQGQGSGNGTGSAASGEGSSGGGSSAAEQGGGTGGRGQGGGHSESLYVPDYVDLSSTSGIDVELPADCIANPNNCGSLIRESPTEFRDEESLIPYEQVFGDYRRAAYSALEDEYVPLGLREYIKEYFTSIEP